MDEKKLNYIPDKVFNHDEYFNYKFFVGSEIEYELIITFHFKKRVDYGKAIYLLGGLEEQGNWGACPLRLNWCEGDNWTNLYMSFNHTSKYIRYNFLNKKIYEKNFAGFFLKKMLYIAKIL